MVSRELYVSSQLVAAMSAEHSSKLGLTLMERQAVINWRFAGYVVTQT
jgi:hypothetical protein